MTEARHRQLVDLLAGRVAVLDGAGATNLQPNVPAPGTVARAVDWLNLTRPEMVGGLHRAFLAAGADIVKTNTFNATSIVQQAVQGTAGDDVAGLVDRLNRAGASLARAAADAAEALDPARPRFVAGVLGPTQLCVSIRSDSARAVAFEALEESYRQAARGLIEGGADLLLIETVVDSRNAEAAIRAARSVGEELGIAIPLMVSATVAEDGVHTLSGQTMTAFWDSFAEAGLASIGLNCAFGARALGPALRALAEVADIPISVHPNAGLPDAGGLYGDSAAAFAVQLREFADAGIVNIVGGCCGTTPAHIAAVVAATHESPPRSVARLK